MLRRSLLAAPALLLPGQAWPQSAKPLRVVMHSDLKIIDPVWTTAYIVRNHGFLIYDQLFALDGKLEPQPQMVESWTVSDDKLTWTFKLRDSLRWHDGQPVTTADVIPSGDAPGSCSRTLTVAGSAFGKRSTPRSRNEKMPSTTREVTSMVANTGRRTHSSESMNLYSTAPFTETFIPSARLSTSVIATTSFAATPPRISTRSPRRSPSFSSLPTM